MPRRLAVMLPLCLALLAYCITCLPPPGFLLLVTVEGPGTVTGPDIECEEGDDEDGDACSAEISGDVGDELTAASSANATFWGWEGGCSGGSLTCLPQTPEGDEQQVTANFAPPVDCDHPGAGDPAGDECVCTPSDYAIAGNWRERYKCVDGNACLDPDTVVKVTIVGGASHINAYIPSESWSATGRYCGNVYVWSGGAGGYTETGTWTFSGADNFTKVSRYEYGGGGGGDCVGAGVRGQGDPPPVSNPPCP